ncbi:MAG: TolC family protein, partial [Leptospiraceae bacterium]|nr:TolC family protein [Leptospiraceae bacterium]
TPDPPLHRPSLFVTFQQELLKNSFGYNDRRQLEIAENAYKRQRAATIDLLSGLVVQALVDYWTVTIETSALENAKTEADMTRTVRNIIARNIRIGLAENFDLNQYNSLLANAEAKVAATEQNLKVAVRKLLRTVNMPADTQVEGITNLIDTLPDLNAEEALQAAFEKRVDYKNAKLELESLEMQSELAANNALPSITANASLTTQGQNTQLLPALQNSGSLDFPVWVVGLKMSYPLWDKEVKATQRNAECNVTKAKIRMEELTQEIRDDVLNKMENVRLTHEVLMRTRESKEQAELYYNRLMARVRQGRFNSVNVKTSLDNLVANRQRELEALVQFNVSILQFDLAKNEIFERYNVDVEKYLAQVK